MKRFYYFIKNWKFYIVQVLNINNNFKSNMKLIFTVMIFQIVWDFVMNKYKVKVFHNNFIL